MPAFTRAFHCLLFGVAFAFSQIVSHAASPLTNVIFGADGPVYAIHQAPGEVQNAAVYVGGRFTRIGDIEARNAAMFSAGRWHPIGTGSNVISGEVNAIAVAPNGRFIFLGGQFTIGTNIQHLAAWDGTNFVRVATVNDRVRALAGFYNGAPQMVAAGDFNRVNGVQAFLVTATEIGGQLLANSNEQADLPDGNIHAIQVTGSGLIFGGSFTKHGNRTVGSAMILRDSGALGSSLLGEEGVEGLVTAIARDPANPRYFYLGGAFAHVTSQGRSEPLTIGRWDTTEHRFNDLSGGMSAGDFPLVHTILAEGGQVYVGGRFEVAGQHWARNIAMWDGATWYRSSAIFGSGIDGAVHALAGGSQRLFIGGSFDSVDSLPAENLVVWENGVRGDFTLPGVPGQLPGTPTSPTNVPASRMVQMPGFERGVTAMAGNSNYIYAAGSRMGGGNTLRTEIRRGTDNRGARSARCFGTEPGPAGSTTCSMPGGVFMRPAISRTSMACRRRISLRGVATVGQRSVTGSTAKFWRWPAAVTKFMPLVISPLKQMISKRHSTELRDTAEEMASGTA
ncbi:MAG TPA: hypothetical protein VF773_20930 [Verrucomicrobiae bacterium]